LKDLSVEQERIAALTEEYYKKDADGKGTWTGGGKALVLDAQKRLSNLAFEASQRNTREAQDREDEYRNVLTKTLIDSTPSQEQILKYADDNNLDIDEAADELNKASNVVAARNVTLIAQQKDPASNLEIAKRPPQLDKDGNKVLDEEGNEVRLSDRQLEGIRAQVVEKLYATGQIKTMPSWDQVLQIYAQITEDKKKKSKAAPAEKTTQYGDRYQFKNSNSRLGDYLTDMIGEFGSVTGPVSAPRTAEGVTGDINFTGIENLSGTPRPDLRTPEQIENNERLLRQ